MAREIDRKKQLVHRISYAAITLAIVGGIAFMLGQQMEALDGTITVEELSKNVGRDPYHMVVVDVRTPEEYAAGHVPWAINVPVDQIGRRLADLEPARERQVAVICESGGRSSRAADLLRQRGFQSVLDVPEGMAGWRAAGKPESTSPDTPFHRVIE